MPHLGLNQKTKHSSFPRRRESSSSNKLRVADKAVFEVLSHCVGTFVNRLDSRLRGNDGLFGACFKKYLSVLFAVLLALVSMQACARGHSHNNSEIQIIAVAGLPPEARDTLRLIQQGGPFPYPRDGVVFGNHEKRLPQQPRGYYHEYTVRTPGARNRGARRVVCGEPAECYYSNDHYKTFRRIRE